MTQQTHMRTFRLSAAGVCLALAMVLPFVTGQIPQIGKALSPMHIPVFLCGFLCGWPYGLAVGAAAPLLRSVLFHMPALYPDAAAMSFELAAYGFLTGVLYRILPKKNAFVYIALIAAMLGGRLVWGAARYVLLVARGSEFPFSAFLAGAFFNAVPGIVLHLVLVPAIVIGLRRSRLLPDG